VTSPTTTNSPAWATRRFADEAIILNRGAIVHRAPAAALLADEAALHTHLTAAG
jgi:ABC-type branched-subunit amino acid transport system ATPase component